jgi:hypothetical protein
MGFEPYGIVPDILYWARPLAADFPSVHLLLQIIDGFFYKPAILVISARLEVILSAVPQVLLR